MSEAELHILKARMLAGRNAKARRGELNKPLPMGYLRRPFRGNGFRPRRASPRRDPSAGDSGPLRRVLPEPELAKLEAGVSEDVFVKLLATVEAIDARHAALEKRLAECRFMTDAEAAFIDGEGEARH
jgi:hypothetical protein